jgi:hypothetical protein
MNRNRGIDYAPDANGAGRDGFTDGDPGVTPASEYCSEQANGVQEEIVRAIELLGGTPSYASNEQLGTLLAAMQARLASQHFVYTTTKTRTVYVPLTAFVPEQSQWTFSGLGWISLVNSGLLYCDLTPYIPAGATVANVTVTWKSGGSEAAGATACQYKLERFLYDASAVNLGTDVVPWILQSTASYEGAPFGDDGHVQQIIKSPPTGCAPLNAIDTKAMALLLTFKASDDGSGGTADILYGVTISLTSDAYVSNW